MTDKTKIPADILAQIEAELAASKARILALLGNASAEPETVATEVTYAEPIRLKPWSSIDVHQIQERQRELRAVINSFEQRVGDDFDLGIVLQRFADTAPLRLHSVTFFGSGAVVFSGLDTLGRSAQLYDTLDRFSVILKKLRRANRSKPRKAVEFYTVI